MLSLDLEASSLHERRIEFCLLACNGVEEFFFNGGTYEPILVNINHLNLIFDHVLLSSVFVLLP